MRRMVYLSNARVPSEKANTKQSMSQCEALGKLYDLEFWHPVRRTALAVSDVYQFYGLERTFRLGPVWCMDAEWLRRRHSRVAFLLQASTFLAACAVRVARLPHGTIVYSRNQFDLAIAVVMRLVRKDMVFFFEDHDGVLRRFAAIKKICLGAVRGIIVTTPSHAHALTAAGVPARKILTSPNAVRLADFGAIEARSTGGRFSVVYAGNLFRRKGVFVLADAAALLPDHYSIEFIGGSPEAERPFRAYLAETNATSRITLRGYMAPRDLPAALLAADVLVLPNSAMSKVSEIYTSPLKLFEYMAAGRPIVASDVGASRNVLVHDRNAVLVRPDDPAALAAGIRQVCEDPSLGARLGAQARRDVESCTWENRAARIADFIGERLHAPS